MNYHTFKTLMNWAKATGYTVRFYLNNWIALEKGDQEYQFKLVSKGDTVALVEGLIAGETEYLVTPDQVTIADGCTVYTR